MKILFWILCSINIIALVVCLHETFAVSSNRSLLIPALLLLGLIVGAILLHYNGYLKLSLALMSLPVFLLLVLLLFLITNKNWQ